MREYKKGNDVEWQMMIMNACIWNNMFNSFDGVGANLLSSD
jgi:hypothetical protein